MCPSPEINSYNTHVRGSNISIFLTTSYQLTCQQTYLAMRPQKKNLEFASITLSVAAVNICILGSMTSYDRLKDRFLEVERE